MLDVTGTTLALLVFIGVSSLVTLYCVVCFVCQRRSKRRADEEDMTPKKGVLPRRYIEIRPNLRQSPNQGYDHPIIQRTQVPFGGSHQHQQQNQRSNQMTTISIIDLRTKLSLNPKTEAEEPPPSYDELFP